MKLPFPALVLALLCMAALAACRGGDATAPGATMRAPVSQAFPLRVGDVTVQIEVPVETAEQRRGLMYRESLPADQGMLFPYKQPQQMTFWMENTQIPLDIGFFDSDGVLREIHSMLPYDRQATRSAARNLRFALEVNQGWFARNKVLPGAVLDKAQLAAALEARGANPAEYGLK